jgi:predicted transglutaminase-like cysteine proteinase
LHKSIDDRAPREALDLTSSVRRALPKKALVQQEGSRLATSSPPQSGIDLGTSRRKIPSRVCVLLAGTLCLVDPFEPTASSAAPISNPRTENVEPAPLMENEGNGAVTRHDAPTKNHEEARLLFGINTEPVGIGELRERWHRVAALMAQDLAVVVQCHSNEACPIAAQRLIDMSAEGAERTGRARVGLINRAAKLTIKAFSDEKQWGVADHWSDPFETLLSYRGDCEDYAIVKYAALLEAGIPIGDLKIVILKNFFPKEYHAVAAARVNGEWLILDNRTLTLVRDTDITRAIPIFVLDHEGVRRFDFAGATPPSRGSDPVQPTITTKKSRN